MKKLITRQINADTSVQAASEDKPMTMEDRTDERLDAVSEDFDYVISGIERLERQGKFDEAMDILDKISDTLNGAIGVIGDTFTDESVDEEF